MRRRQTSKREKAENTDRWLLTYADLITLLLGLFVILYAMSKVDNSKYSQVVKALGGMFGKTAVIPGSPMVLPSELGPSERITIENKVRSALYEDINANLVSLSQDEQGVVVHLAEELLFPSGSATLKTSSLGSLDLLASVLKTLPNEIRIEGHTDDIPIKTALFPSNWHLSVARAMNAGEYLIRRSGVRPDKVTMVGYSEFKPLVPNTSEENRAKNRRVDIVIISSEPTQSNNNQRSAG